MSGRTLRTCPSFTNAGPSSTKTFRTRAAVLSRLGGFTADLDRRTLNDVSEAVAYQDPGDLSQTTQVSDIHVRQGDLSESPP